MCLSLEPNLFPHVRKCTSAIEVWQKIQELFEDRGHLRRCGLLEKIMLNKLENCESMVTYVANVITTILKLENVGQRCVDDNWTITLLLFLLGPRVQTVHNAFGC